MATKTITCLALAAALAGCAREPPPTPRLLASRTVESPVPGQIVSWPLQAGSDALLIRVDSRDVNFRSRIRDGNGQVVSEIALDFLRSAPVWHLLEQGSRGAGQIEIEPVHATRKAWIRIDQMALDTGTHAGRQQLRAWKRLARGLQKTEGEAEADWAENLAALTEAEAAFNRLGLHEPALWAAYFNAYFKYYPLYRYAEALQAARIVGRRAERLERPELRLLAHQLAGQIRIEREADADEAEARTNYRLAQQEFAAALELARASGNGFETIWALNNSGITFHYQGLPEKAIQRYIEALNLATDLHDSYLIHLIGTNIAVAQAKLGRIGESIETLNQTLNSLDSETAPHEAEHVLTVLGTYYRKLHRLPEALEVLDRAIGLAAREGRTESLGRNRLLLAKTYRELGQPDRSLRNLRLALPDLEASRNGRGLQLALALSADLHRHFGDFQAMHADRARQKQFLANGTERAEWLDGRARDAEAEGAIFRAVELYRESAALYRTTPFGRLGRLAELHACVLTPNPATEPGCATAELEPAFASLAAMQASRPALEARWLWARLLAREGRGEAATDTLRQLIREMLFLRRDLPGVLGAWYWEARREIFDFYMSLALGAGSPPERHAAASLAALLWLRSAGDPVAEQPHRGTEGAFGREVRALLAQREQATTPEASERAQRQLDRYLLAHDPSSAGIATPPSIDEVVRRVRSLPAGWSLLTFYAAPQRLYAWTADANGLKWHDLGPAEDFPERIAELKENLRAIHYPALESDLAEWGRRLIAPLLPDLEDRIVFIGSGAFSDFPIEALIVDGSFLLRRHTVLNLVAGFDLENAIRRLRQPLEPSRIFLAGNPSGLDPGQPELAGSAAELEAVQHFFPAAETTRLEGPALTLAALNQPAFDNAELVHLASHAQNDRAYPELSSMRLSGRTELGPERLTPADLLNRRIAAQLVVLSACTTVGVNRFEFDTHLGFVSAFLQQGGQHVLASLWPIPDRATAALMAEFYRRAKDAPDLAAALREAKLARIQAGESGPGSWAAFQLFGR